MKGEGILSEYISDGVKTKILILDDTCFNSTDRRRGSGNIKMEIMPSVHDSDVTLYITPAAGVTVLKDSLGVVAHIIANQVV